MGGGRCKYCKCKLPDPSNIRCDKCNQAWTDGFRDGEQQLKAKLKETTTHLLRFLGIMP